ncbi:MAG: FAD-dependent oxidoreductase [Gracilibacteraceae bacterium]|jgi:2,4-dienoyl-CoA reductase-like NADH-dependent reductase (Old Yellow Enzyme family)/thioredoxin reductase|nr:FAD-dependent oxidoreductase [Gracilibacteraceae bacterium]
MQQFKTLFSQGRIGKRTTKNRVVMAPMGDCFANPDGTINDRYIAYYTERAKHGVGVIMPGVLCVDFPLGRGIAIQARIDTLQNVHDLAFLATQVHRYDALLIPQLHHAGAMSSRDRTSGQVPVCVTKDIEVEHVLVAPFRGIEEQRELTTEDVRVLRDKFIAAAKYCWLAKCDGVEIQCAHGYFINQFLSRDYNGRSDEYGGSLENRMRFPVEVIRGIRAECGPDFIVGARIPGFETVKRGLTRDEIITIAKTFESAGANHLHVSTGCVTRFSNVEECQGYEQGWRVKNSKAIKENVGIPVITVGVLRDPQVCEDVLNRNDADFVAIGRPLLADVEWVEKAQSGRENEIRHCICCLDGCLEHMATGEAIACTLNPLVGYEREYSVMPKAAAAKKVVVVGGGAAGMQAAITAAQTGHKVTLLEKSGRLGGQLNLACIPPTKEMVRRPLEWLQDELVRQGITVRMNFAADAKSIQAMDPDFVFVATGAVPSVPPIPGVEAAVQAWDVIEGKIPVSPKQKVAILGGGIVGCETAMLLGKNGNKLVLIEMLPALANGLTEATKQDVLADLQEKKVEMLTSTTVKSIDAGRLTVSGPAGEAVIQADLVVLAAGARPFAAELAGQLREAGLRVRTLGDVNKPAKIINAIHDSFWAAMALL